MAESADGQFKLSATLSGHTSDVRAVLLPDPSFAITASRDGSTRTWKQTSKLPDPPFYDPTESSHGSQFKTCLAYLQPTKEFPEGLILSSGQDTIIEARQPDTTAERNADAMLLGHGLQVCALDVNTEAGYIISGSWDKSARLWEVGRWESQLELQGHTAAVWAVVAYDRETVVTGCADHAIRCFDLRGKMLISFDGKDVIRAIAKLPEDHSSGGQIVSASNDGVIRIWTLKGDQLAELYGHESFIYSLAVLPSGEIVSSGEDRTVRIWRDTECVQVITLPAISVWSVSTCSNGDFIVGSSDKIARIFTKDPRRIADSAAITDFEETVRASAIPREQVGTVNKEELPGPEFLTQKSGTKEGQNQMVREANGTTTLYQWSMQVQQWIKVGEVVDSAGSSSSKQNYAGKDYDYVFDIDIEDGKPALKLPYNVTQNPYEAATKFLQDNELPLTYLEETANFIVKNTQGASLGAPTQSGPDAWGTENRYRPGEVPTSSYKPPPPSSKPSLPHKEYLSITVGKPSAAFQQIAKVNAEHTSAGRSEFAVSGDDLQSLKKVSEQLQTYNFSSTASMATSPAVKSSIFAALKIGTEWQPPASRLAGLDILRFLAAALEDFPPQGKDLVRTIAISGAFDATLLQSNTKLAMISTRLFSNLLYSSPYGRAMVQSALDSLLEALSNTSALAASDVSLAVALTTFYLNLAVFITKDPVADEDTKADRALSILEQLSQILRVLPAVDHKQGATALAQSTEPAYRGVMSLGTVIVGFKHRDEILMAAREVFEVPALLTAMKGKGWLGEPRFQVAVKEIRDALT